MAKKRIGIFTGGGDVPGLNSVIKTVTYRSSENDIEVVGLRRGWEGLTLTTRPASAATSSPWTARIPVRSIDAVAPCCIQAAPIHRKCRSCPITSPVRTFRPRWASGTAMARAGIYPDRSWRILPHSASNT